MSQPALELRGISHSFRGIPVLEDVDLTLQAQDFVGLIGPNGAGKTVLLKIILGLLKPNHGSIHIFGEPVTSRHGKVAWVPQFAQFQGDFPICVRDVVRMGVLGQRHWWQRYWWQQQDAATEGRVAAALRQLDLESMADRQVGKLSGGQMQRVLIARALAQDARIILLDEPAASLDSRFGDDLFELLKELSQERAVLLVSHDIGVLHKYVTSVACLNRRLTSHGSSEITQAMLEATYGEHVELVEHPHTHRLLSEHVAPPPATPPATPPSTPPTNAAAEGEED